VPGEYLALARELGQLIGRGGHTLIWGGGSVGLMGELGAGAQQEGGRVVGIIPDFMAGTEVAYRGADELVVVPDMRQRKALMEARAGAFIVLPGGIGTLDEMFEILTLRVLGRHHKPLALINHRGFYDGLLTFMERLYDEKFLRPAGRAHYTVVPDAAAALAAVNGRV
jgi:uncharacterized protein (TIGR00730 family)